MPSNNSEQWQLVATGSWLSGQRFPLTAHTVLGRDTSCDITIAGTHLSRQHAELVISQNNLLVRDLNSSNGTYVNDQQITESQLKPGDKIRFDVLEFIIHGPNQSAQQHSRQRPSVNSEKTGPSSRQWKTKPTSVGNRDKTVFESTGQKTVRSFGYLAMAVVAIATLAGLVFLFSQL